MNKSKIINIAGIVAFLILLIFAAGYLLLNRSQPNSQVASNGNTSVQQRQAPAAGGGAVPFPPTGAEPQTAYLDTRSIGERTSEIFGRLLLAVILSAILAFRPRKNVKLFRRNLYVAQTQILLAVVAAALMLIVGDNTARAFAIFAAVSLVRFRTNIRDPKEITVLLISLALGLAAGVGHWDLGIALCLFALALLWILEFREPEQVFRSMELTVKTRNTEHTQAILKGILGSYGLESEVRQIEPPESPDEIGCVMYYVNLRLNISTDSLSDKIFAADADNIEGIQWEQKKNAAYIYQ
jgi:hypothetical protein